MRQPDGMVSGFGRIAEGRQPSTILQRLTVPYVDRATCIESKAHFFTPCFFTLNQVALMLIHLFYNSVSTSAGGSELSPHFAS